MKWKDEKLTNANFLVSTIAITTTAGALPSRGRRSAGRLRPVSGVADGPGGGASSVSFVGVVRVGFQVLNRVGPGPRDLVGDWRVSNM